MKKAILTSAFLGIFLSLSAQSRGVLNADLGRDTISRNIYGHFAEHLGRCIYDGFYVGEKSKIPNRDGVRTDIIDALKKLKVANLRWPGGCFADTYQWKDGIGPKDIGLKKLFDRASDGTVHELILATNFTAEGEATAHVITQALKERGLQITRLARGVPVGSELEYVDLGTIAHALVDRR